MFKDVYKKVLAFSKSEILLSLVIICVTLAIIMPPYLKNADEKMWEDGRRSLFARLSAVLSYVEPLDEYENADALITNGLLKDFEIARVCQQNKIQDCGIDVSGFKRLDGSHTVLPTSWADLGFNLFSYGGYPYGGADDRSMVAAFETVQGEAIMVFYNPICTAAQYENPTEITSVSSGVPMLEHVCLNLVYDLNKNVAPNVFGKDIGVVTVFYPENAIISAPLPEEKMSAITDTDACTEGYRIPNRYEAASLALNHKLLTSATFYDYLTSSKVATLNAVYQYKQARSNDMAAYTSVVFAGNTRCVKR